MIGAFWICVAMIVIGIILYIGELRWRRKHRNNTSAGDEISTDTQSAVDADNENNTEDSGECCGLHLVCEKDSLSPMSAEIIYYDDEELDRFIGRAAESYDAEETEEFRDVLMTLRPEDVAGWARSITQRHLELPPEVRDELLMLVNEQRRLS